MRSQISATADSSAIEIRLPSGHVRVSTQPLESIDKSFERRWLALEECAVEANTFLSPHFALPAWRHDLTPSITDKPDGERNRTAPMVLTIEQDVTRRPETVQKSDDAPRRLIGLGLFEESRGNTLMPLPMLKCWRSEHSYFDGLLIDREFTDSACEAFFAWLRSTSRRWHGVSFTERSVDGPLADALSAAAEHAGITWHEDYALERAAILPDELPSDCFTLYPRSRRQNLRRRRRRLTDHGPVTLHCRPLASEDVETELDTFLRLEAAGWKGDRGSALGCTARGVAFLHDMVPRFAADGRVILCRLDVNDDPIATSLNLLAGDTLSGFKMGWHPDWHQHSPGIQCAFGLMEGCGSLPDSLKLVDGCASPGGYLDSVWPARRRLTTGVFATTATGRLTADTLGRIKGLKRLVKSALS